MKKLEFARAGYIFISFTFYAAAGIFSFFPNLSPMALSCFGGVFLIAFGIIMLMVRFPHRSSENKTE